MDYSFSSHFQMMKIFNYRTIKLKTLWKIVNLELVKMFQNHNEFVEARNSVNLLNNYFSNVVEKTIQNVATI